MKRHAMPAPIIAYIKLVRLVTCSGVMLPRLKILEPEHVGHGIKPRLLATRPQRRMQRTTREDHAVLSLVHELDALGRPGENHAVLADHAAAAQRGEADIARLARAGVAVAARNLMLVEIDAAPFRRRAAEHQCGTG